MVTLRPITTVGIQHGKKVHASQKQCKMAVCNHHGDKNQTKDNHQLSIEIYMFEIARVIQREVKPQKYSKPQDDQIETEGFTKAKGLTYITKSHLVWD